MSRKAIKKIAIEYKAKKLVDAYPDIAKSELIAIVVKSTQSSVGYVNFCISQMGIEFKQKRSPEKISLWAYFLSVFWPFGRK